MRGNKAFTSKDRSLKKLLVEGADDANVCYHLLRSHNIPIKERDTQKANDNGIEIIDIKGIENLLKSLPRQIQADSGASLGIVVDADEDITGRWQSLRDIVLKAGYSTTPTDPDLEGTIIHESDQPIIGI